uniref:Uncharacterized protein n=1 Tax=Triticum urartu TaxID=4572 RepID=A0A8R7RC12_TRIUA
MCIVDQDGVYVHVQADQRCLLRLHLAGQTPCRTTSRLNQAILLRCSSEVNAADISLACICKQFKESNLSYLCVCRYILAHLAGIDQPTWEVIWLITCTCVILC